MVKKSRPQEYEVLSALDFCFVLSFCYHGIVNPILELIFQINTLLSKVDYLAQVIMIVGHKLTFLIHFVGGH